MVGAHRLTDVEREWRDLEPASETILPSQLAESAARPPEHRLMLAVIEEAFHGYVASLNRSDRRSRRRFKEVEGWFASDDVSWPFSFVALCEKLDLQPDYIRAGLRRLRYRGVSRRRVGGQPIAA